MSVSVVTLQAGFDVLGDGRPETIWLALGTVMMLLGTFYFIVKGWGVTDEQAREYYSITILVPAIATAAYLSMFFGYGLAEIPVEGRGMLEIYWARYADWLFTTPLLLLDLALLAGADRTTIGTLVSIDAFMIVTGAVGALSGTALERYVWWTVSTIAFVFLLYFLLKNLREAAKDKSDEVRSTFNTLTILVAVLWSAYPVWWLVGTEGAGLVSLSIETLGFAFLDVTAKVGFGFILLRSRAIMGDTGAPEPSASEGEAAAAD